MTCEIYCMPGSAVMGKNSQERRERQEEGARNEKEKDNIL
jgi:hypothetical protein